MTALQDFTRNKAWYIENWDWVLNGTYGEEPYKRYRRQYQEALSGEPYRQRGRMRQIVIHAFTSLVAEELGVSYGHAQKTIVKAIPERELADLTNRFIEELHDLME